ncbi:MAG: response regulator [Patescibacteria group bacterium]
MALMNPNKILIVEDEETLALVLKEKFEKNHFSTKVVNDGGKAFAAAKSYKPNVIALDLMLPNQNGIDILKELKSDDATKMIPVIVVSNLMDDTTIKEALKLGAKDYFVKADHSINEIFEKIKAYIV